MLDEIQPPLPDRTQVAHETEQRDDHIHVERGFRLRLDVLERHPGQPAAGAVHGGHLMEGPDADLPRRLGRTDGRHRRVVGAEAVAPVDQRHLRGEPDKMVRPVEGPPR